MPVDKKWIRDVPESRRPKLFETPVFPMPHIFTLEKVLEALKYKARDDDVFLETYPKSGTHWAENILYQIQHDANPTKLAWPENVIFLEQGIDGIENLPKPNIIRNHLPATAVPWNDKAKYVVVIRNPKDVLVSFYHHTVGLDKAYMFEGSFDDYFDLFIGGQVDFGDYFDHVNSWLAKRDCPNVLILTYEEMKINLSDVIRRMAEFLGDKYAKQAADDPNFVEKIVQQTTLSALKGKEHVGAAYRVEGTTKSDFSMYRKGLVNDWKNIFSKQQNEDITRRFKEEAEKNPQLLTLWPDYSWLNDGFNGN